MRAKREFLTITELIGNFNKKKSQKYGIFTLSAVGRNLIGLKKFIIGRDLNCAWKEHLMLDYEESGMP